MNATSEARSNIIAETILKWKAQGIVVNCSIYKGQLKQGL